MHVAPPAGHALLARLAAARGLSLTELARRAGVSRRSVGRWNGGDVPTQEQMRRLAEALEMEPGDLASQFYGRGGAHGDVVGPGGRADAGH